jgi:hypothetical protein
MPPDDEIFPKAGGDTQESDTQQAQQATPPAGASREEVSALIDEKLGPIQKSTEQLNQFLAGLQEQNSTQQAAAAEPANSEDWATKFYNSPQDTVQNEIQSVTEPTVRQVASTMGQLLLDKQKESVSSEFGPEAWDTYFDGPLSTAVANAVKEYPGSLMNPTAVENAVKTIKGDKFSELTALRAKIAEAKPNGPDEETVEQVANRVVEMTGGIRRTPNSSQEKLDDAESQEFLNAHFKETGTKIDTSRLAKLMNSGNSIEDWQAMNKELEK